MEVDSAHSLIERRLKNKDIYLPTDYIRVCLEARPKKSFIVKYLCYTDFLNFTNIKYYTNIRPGYKVDDPTVSDIRSLKYDPEGKITYKLNYSDEWKQYTKRPNLSGNFCITINTRNELKLKLRNMNTYKSSKKKWMLYFGPTTMIFRIIKNSDYR